MSDDSRSLGSRQSNGGAPLGLTVHILKVTLLDVTPQVWRVIRVPSAVTLSALHAVVQVAMGWEDRHLHEWTVGDDVYTSPDEDDWGDDSGDETEAVLGELVGADAVLRYDYDFGDGWEHLVEVVSVDDYDGAVAPVEVLDGARSAPPEGCGGPSGYEHLLDVPSDPDDEEHDDVVERFGDWFDPAAFDRVAINRRLEVLWRVV